MLLKIKAAGNYLFSFVPGLVTFLRRALSENGEPSFSHVSCAILIAAYVEVMITRNNVPDNSEMFAAVLLALYGANQFKCGMTGYRTSAPGMPPPNPPPPGSGI